MPQEEPCQVRLTASQAEALQERIQLSNLAPEDINLMVGLLRFNLWLQDKLSKAQLSIQRLKRFFGFSTEKDKKKVE